MLLSSFRALYRHLSRAASHLLDTLGFRIDKQPSNRFSSDPTSPLQTLPSYLSLATPLLSLILQIPPLTPSSISLRTTFLLRLTGDVMGAIVGYKPRVEDLDGLLEWVGVLDVGWEGVLRGVPWEAAILSGSGESGIRSREVVGDDGMVVDGGGGGGQSGPDGERERVKVITQTEKTRLKSLLITGAARIDEWLEALQSDDQSRIAEQGDQEAFGEGQVGDYVNVLESRGLRERFERLFERTLGELEVENMIEGDGGGFMSLSAGGIGSRMEGSAMRENGEVEMTEGTGDINSDDDT